MAVQLYTQSEQSVHYALVGYEDGTVAVWNTSAGSLVASKQLHAEPVMALAVASNGSGMLLEHNDLVHSFLLALQLDCQTHRARFSLSPAFPVFWFGCCFILASVQRGWCADSF